MKKLYRKSTVHPTAPLISDHLAFLPAAILTLAVALSPPDREVLAYLLSCSSTNRKPSRKTTAGDHAPSFTCNCFRCYTSYWIRWDSSPNRQLIHEIIDAFEDGDGLALLPPENNKNDKNNKNNNTNDKNRNKKVRRAKKGGGFVTVAAGATSDEVNRSVQVSNDEFVELNRSVQVSNHEFVEFESVKENKNNVSNGEITANDDDEEEEERFEKNDKCKTFRRSEKGGGVVAAGATSDELNRCVELSQDEFVEEITEKDEEEVKFEKSGMRKFVSSIGERIWSVWAL